MNAHWEMTNPEVSPNDLKVRPAGLGYHVQIGQQTLWVGSKKQWDDITHEIEQGFDSLPSKPTWTFGSCRDAVWDGGDDVA